MNLKNFFQKNWIHFAAVAVFIIVAAAYFSPQFGDYSLKQDDVEKFKGMSNEIEYYRAVNDKEPLWTNGMFGGMPTTQISTLHEGSIIRSITKGFMSLFPSPAGILILHLISFYILALFLRIKPIIGIVGAFAFAFASYEIVILHAGHNSKAMAVAFLPAVLGAFIYAYRQNWKWGAAFSALFLAFELSANHLQVTYYLAYLLFAIGVYFGVQAIREKKIKSFAITSAAVLGGYVIAMLMNYGSLTMTNSYVKYTMRGDNDLTINADGTPLKSGQDGLPVDYITQWSYGKSESLTLLSPYVKGSHSASIDGSSFQEMGEDMVDNDEIDGMEYNLASNGISMYWGNQPGTSGPVYLGVVVVFLAFLSLFFVKDRIKWVYLGISLLMLLFSWGSNAMGMTEFFVKYFPMYNKFRTVTIALVLLELLVPLMAILVLQKLYEAREELKEQKKLFFIASGIFVVFLIGMKLMSPDRFAPEAKIETQAYDNYVNGTMQQLMYAERQQPGYIQNNLRIDPRDQASLKAFAEQQAETAFTGMRKFRKALYQKSTSRSLLIGIVAIGLVALLFFTNLNAMAVVGGLAALVLIDLIPVDRNYLSDAENESGDLKHWMAKDAKLYPVQANNTDEQIMEMELKENPQLQKAVDKGERLGKQEADELGITGDIKRRVVDSYRFQALSAATNYRVFSYNDGWNGTHAAYFHKSLGGYSAVKLRRIQNAFEFHIANSNNEFLNMMNVKYFIQGSDVRLNPTANGNAWAVKEVKVLENPDDEIRALGKKFEVKQLGDGQLLVNKEIVKSKVVYGTEKMVFVTKAGDSIPVPVSNGIDKGMTAYFVMDVQGNTNLVPEMTIKADTVNSFIQIAAITCTDDFDSKTTAVMVSKQAEKLTSKKYSGEADVKLSEYAPNKLTYDVNAKGKQLIVFSEIYYPEGWTATIDGKEVDILRVDYLLRGLEVAGGKHKVEFTYDVARYHTGNTLAMVSSVLMVILFGGMLFLYFKKPELLN